MTRRASKRELEEAHSRVVAQLEAMAVEESYILQALKQAGSLRLQDVGNLGPAAQDVCDRLVAKGLVTRYPGTIFGVSPQGERLLSGDQAV